MSGQVENREDVRRETGDGQDADRAVMKEQLQKEKLEVQSSVEKQQVRHLHDEADLKYIFLLPDK